MMILIFICNYRSNLWIYYY